MTAVRPIHIITGITAMALIAAAYYMFDPAGSTFFPRCPFLTLTGLKCPGCGSQRALHALLHGNLHEAWRMNALLMLELPLIALLLLSGALSHRCHALKSLLSSRPFILTVTSTIIIWTIVRNIVNI